MTGIPIVDAGLNFFNFIRMLALIGIVGFGGLLLIAASGYFAQPYSRWGLFVREYITGENRPWGRNWMGYGLWA